MAYKISKGTTDIGTIPTGLPTLSQVNTFVRNALDVEEFYELEPAEVIDIVLTDDDLVENNLLLADKVTPDYRYIGAIKARYIISGTDLEDDELDWCFPLDSNVQDFPLKGEYVICVNYLGKVYYTQKLNILNSVNSNSFPGISSMYLEKDKSVSDAEEVSETGITNRATEGMFEPGDYFRINNSIRRVRPEEGDIIYNGRFGNSIRLGSNQSSGEGYEISPNILFRAGQLLDASKLGEGETVEDINSVYAKPVEEDINADGSSLYLTTNETVDLTPAAESQTAPHEFSGRQIILNSDRIIFNSKNDNDIHAFSSRNINLSAAQRINFESPIINLGDRFASEPVLKGNMTVEVLEDILDALNMLGKSLHGAHYNNAGNVQGLAMIQRPGATLAEKAREIKNGINKVKSTQVFTI